MFEILENANAPEGVYASHEDANYKKIGVLSVKRNIIRSASNVDKTFNSYTILTDEDYKDKFFSDRKNSSIHRGQEGIMKYEDKKGSTDLEDIRRDQIFTIVNIENSNGKMALTVMSKSKMQKVEGQYIEMNYTRVSSQEENFKHPIEVINTNNADKSVIIKFRNIASPHSGYMIAYRKANEHNSEWIYVVTDKEECKLEDVEEVNYFVRVMYFSHSDFSFFSGEILMNFY